MMRLKIVGIGDRGDPLRERLHVSVLAPSNLVNYAVFSAQRVLPNSVKTPPDFAYWFAPLLVYPGDQVILYTGPGQTNSEQRPDGRWNRFLYWGLGSTVWQGPNSCVVLLEINEWDTKFLTG
jgi:hypothetical protein